VVSSPDERKVVYLSEFIKNINNYPTKRKSVYIEGFVKATIAFYYY